NSRSWRTVKCVGKYSRFAHYGKRLREAQLYWLRGVELAAIDFPIAFAVISKMQEPGSRVMALAARGTLQITAPSSAVMIVVFGDRKRRAATAGHEKHLQALF